METSTAAETVPHSMILLMDPPGQIDVALMLHLDVDHRDRRIRQAYDAIFFSSDYAKTISAAER